VADTKDGAIFPLAVLFANPPPEIFWIDEFQRSRHWRLFDPVRGDTIAVSLKNDWPIAQECSEKAGISMFVEAPDWFPGLACHIHILRMAVGSASLAEFNLEDIQQRGLVAVRVAGFLEREAARDCLSDNPNPLFCGKADSSDTTIAVLVRVGEAENPV
jgi:hypothetical protein